MKKYKVKITDEALVDMEHLYNHIQYILLAPESAKRQYDRIADAILELAVFPERFQKIGAKPWHSMGLRRMPVDRYSVFYVIDGDSVIVTDVLYSASDIESRLKGPVNR